MDQLATWPICHDPPRFIWLRNSLGPSPGHLPIESASSDLFFSSCRPWHRKIEGDEVNILGPLGHGFAVEDETQTLLLAGGMGIVPFVGYAYRHPKPWNLTMLFGHRAPIDCYPVDSIKERITVDTLRETVPGDLDNLIFSIEERMHDIADQNGLVLACGPTPFLKTVQNFAKKFQVRTQLSLENRMACGVGACLGCVTKTTKDWPDSQKAESYVQVCTHGPVFWANQIDF